MVGLPQWLRSTVREICSAATWASPTTFINHYRIVQDIELEDDFGSKVLEVLYYFIEATEAQSCVYLIKCLMKHGQYSCPVFSLCRPQS